MKFRNIIAAAALTAGLAATGISSAQAAPAPVAQVTGLHVTAATTTTLAVAWTAPADKNAKVRVQVYDADTLADSFDTAHLAPNGDVSGKASVTAAGLTAGTAYDVRADAYDGSRNAGWSAPVTVYTAASGAAGTQGPAGPAGPSGVVAVDTETGTATLAHVGGSWSTGHTAVKDVALKAGTYFVTLTGDFYKTATTTATPVLQVQLNGASAQLTGYTGAFPYNAAEAAGTGTDGTPNGLEQTAVAEGIVTMAADGTVEADAFGYNPDRGSEGGGDFAVSVTVSFTAVQPQAAS